MKIKKVLALGLILTTLTGAAVYAATDIEDKASDLSQSLYNIVINLQSKVDDGTITQERADNIIENLEKRLESFETFDFNNEKINKGKNMNNMKSHQLATIYSELTGTEIEEVFELCEEGEKSILTLAYENGVYEELVNILIEETKIKLEQSVEEGKITQEKADEIISDLQSNLETYDPDNSFFQKNSMRRFENLKDFRGFDKGTRELNKENRKLIRDDAI